MQWSKLMKQAGVTRAPTYALCRGCCFSESLAGRLHYLLRQDLVRWHMPERHACAIPHILECGGGGLHCTA